MVLEIGNTGLVAAYLLLLALIAVQYRRDAMERQRLSLLVGLCLTGLSYNLSQVADERFLPAGTALDPALDALALAVLVAGLWFGYRWWRRRDADSPVGQ